MLIDKDTFKNRSISDSTTIYRFADVINKLDERLIDIEKVKHKLTDLVTRIEVGEGEGEEEYRKEVMKLRVKNQMLLNCSIFISATLCFIISVVLCVFNDIVSIDFSVLCSILSIISIIYSYKTAGDVGDYFMIEKYVHMEKSHKKTCNLILTSISLLFISFALISLSLVFV